MSDKQLDNFFDGIINNFNIFLEKKNVFKELNQDINFVKYQNTILNYIKDFTDNINENEYKVLTNNKKHISILQDIVKRYCAYFIYLGIAYYYSEGRDLYITNIIETSKNQKDSIISIPNFFNSYNNSKLIHMFTIIKNIQQLIEFKTWDRIKITISNNPVNYSTTIDFFNSIGEDFIIEYILVKNNFHNLLKAFIFRQIYYDEDKNDIIKLFNEEEEEDAEYKYIEIVVGKDEKLIDFTILKQFLSGDDIKKGYAEEYYEYLEQYRGENITNILNNNKIIDFLFSNGIIIPISEDFLRYHNDNFKYDKNIDENIKDRDATKIKFVVNYVNKVKNLYSEMYKKNPKLILSAKELFYKQIKEREAILYNDNEEINIINKLEQSQKTTDLDYVVDLESIRNYGYQNYKDFSKDGFRLRSSKNIDTVRYSGLKYEGKQKLEVRKGHSDIPMNVVGIIFNPSNIPLECFNYNDMINIRKNNENAFEGFTNIFNDKYGTNDRNIYYWLFDTKKDIINLNEYKNVSSINTNKYIENMITEIYNIYITKFIDNIIKNIKKEIKSISLPDIYNYIDNSNNFQFKENIDLQLNKLILHKLLNVIYNDININNKFESNLDKTLKLPTSNLIKTKSDIIIVGKKDIDIDLEKIYNEPICLHYLKWSNIAKIPKKNVDEVNQAVFEFVKTYVTTNDVGSYICNSCGEMVSLKKYNWEGTYVKELDTFLTTSLTSTKKLIDVPKYSKFTRVIRNLEKIIEKISYTIGLNFYIGNTNIIKMRRSNVIKEVLDLVLLHTKYLKNQPKDRIAVASNNYGINKNLTNLFFFELKDDIFLTSSTDTDYYKIIKYNNIICYTLFVMMTEINNGQLMMLKEDKKVNYYLYSKIGKNLFSNIFLRVGEKQKINIDRFYLFDYILFYLSGMVVNNNIWMWNINDKNINPVNIQKTCIHTMIDLMNTLFEANMAEKKNFQYEIIVNRLRQKIKTVYNDKLTFDTIVKNSQNNIKVSDGKVSFIKKKEIYFNVNDENLQEKIYKTSNIKKICHYPENYLKKVSNLIHFYYDNSTNCPDGNFHKWKFNKDTNYIECSKCKTKYNEIKYSNELNKENIKNNKLLYLKQLAQDFCPSGNYHQPNEKNICTKCKKDLNNIKYTNNELYEMENNIIQKNNKEILTEIEKVRNNNNKKKEYKNHINTTIDNLYKKYEQLTNNKLINYIDDFIDNLVKIVGKKIKINNNDIFLQDTVYIINNDYLGNPLKNKIYIYSSDNKIKTENNHDFFKMDVLYYEDKTINTTVYYDNKNKNYVGYFKNGKYNKYKSNSIIGIKLSIKDMLLNLGIENQYYNINYINNKYIGLSTKEILKNNDYIIKQTIINRYNNLKNTINNIISIVDKVKYKKKNTSNITDKYHKLIKDIKLTNNENKDKFFKRLPIINNLSVKSFNHKINLSNNYFDISFLYDMNNIDNLLIFLIIYNFTKLINYNQINKTNITNLIVEIIYKEFHKIYLPIDNIEIRRLDAILINEPDYIDPSLRIIGSFNELINVNYFDMDTMMEEMYDATEEMAAVEIDDYEDEEEYLDPDFND
jgi:hypothetical protein